MKDYAKHSRKSGPGPAYKILLVLCILVSLGGLLYLSKELIKTTEEFSQLSPATETKLPEKTEKPVEKAKAPTATAKKPETSTKPRFDFYTLLPKMKMSSSAKESPAIQQPIAEKNKSSERFVLQIASLQNPNSAEELISRLNLLGVETQTELIQRKGQTSIRILSKPYSSFKEAETAQERLHEHHIESLLVKIKP